MADIADICRLNLACSCIGDVLCSVFFVLSLGDGVTDADCTEGGGVQGWDATFPV